MKLLLVESPAKAKKIQSYVGSTYTVRSSNGHFMELNTKQLSKMIQTNFTPIFQPISSKKKLVSQLRSLKPSSVILAADDDREGDAIAWHCGNLFKVNFEETNRITFNEISSRAILDSLQNPKKLNMNSVQAQKTRQLLDLIIGFKLSPLLWKHIKTNVRGLSAGRVQSCLLNLLICHEKKIQEFQEKETYPTKALFSQDNRNLSCKCLENFTKKEEALSFLEELVEKDIWKLTQINQTKETKYPPFPFITSTLQQAAQIELGFNVSQTMKIAQKLYESGKITYMRTDSTFISPAFHFQLKTWIVDHYGEDYYQRFSSKKKTKGAQEAHEAIRPTNINFDFPNTTNSVEKKLYDLIKKRTVISNMKPALYDVYEYILKNETCSYLFQGTEKHLTFAGFLNYSSSNQLTTYKPFQLHSLFTFQECSCQQTFSQPPTYWNESQIVKKLDSSGVGRPSTYASIIATLYNRHYTEIKNIPEKERSCIQLVLKNKIITNTTQLVKVKQQSKRVVPTPLGHTVIEYLQEHFSTMIAVEFTAQVETDLDLISSGALQWKDVIQRIYNSFMPIVSQQMKFKTLKKKECIYLDRYVLKKGRYGHYLQDKQTNANYNVDLYLKRKRISLDSLTDKNVKEIIQYPKLLGQYKNKSIKIHLGMYGYYMSYCNKNYKIKSNRITYEDCVAILTK